MKIAAAIFFVCILIYGLGRFIGEFIRFGNAMDDDDRDTHRHFGLPRKSLEDIARESQS